MRRDDSAKPFREATDESFNAITIAIERKDRKHDYRNRQRRPAQLCIAHRGFVVAGDGSRCWAHQRRLQSRDSSVTMNADSPDARYAQFADGWKRRSWARIALTSLCWATMIVIFGVADNPVGYLVVAMIVAFCLLDIVSRRRQSAALSKGAPSDWLGVSRREQSTLRAAAWTACLPAIAVLVKMARRSLAPSDLLALAFFIACALCFGFFLLPRAKVSGESLRVGSPSEH